MKIEIEKSKNLTTVKTVDGVFRCKTVEKSTSEDCLEFDDSEEISLETLLQNIFSVTQNDHQLVLEIKEKE